MLRQSTTRDNPQNSPFKKKFLFKLKLKKTVRNLQNNLVFFLYRSP